MTNESLIYSLAAVVDRLSATGNRWWPGTEMAPVTVRRWDTYSRRHPKAKRVTIDERVLDLAKGLQTHFELGFGTPLSEWRDLAEALAE